jgi:hypothetical protein
MPPVTKAIDAILHVFVSSVELDGKINISSNMNTPETIVTISIAIVQLFEPV